MLSKQAAIAVNRFGLGARPRDGTAIGRDPRGWLGAQLDAAKSAPPAPRGPRASARVLTELRDLRAKRAAQARANPARAPSPEGADAAQPRPGLDRDAIRELAAFTREQYVAQTNERHRRAIETDAPFVERLVHFWSNHFAVSADKALVGPIAGHYESEAIRPHVTGNFYDLLLAAERHPAMILYLDNGTSMGPRSAAAGVARRRGRELGLNENLAREILELHTLGVDGGYGQRDVTELAKVLTGWSIGGAIGPGTGRLGGLAARGAADAGQAGEFHFRAAMHEPGEKTVLGRRFEERGAEEGEEVLAMLARHPATARHLATKLARHFVADEPPARLVERLADAYLENDAGLAPVYRALIAADESWRDPLSKYKTPQEFVISAYRALDHVPDDLRPITAILTELGQRPFTAGSPAGWPDVAAHWNGSDPLLKRIEWGAAVGRRVGGRVDVAELAAAVLGPVNDATLDAIRGAPADQALALLIAAPEFQRR